jgi:hypothetical protein
MSKGHRSPEILERMRQARIAVHEEARRQKNENWIIEDGLVRIPLSKGYEAIIDEGDAEEARFYSWHAHIAKRSNTVYAIAHIPGIFKPRKEIFLHNLVFKPKVGTLSDHIDGNGLNCRRNNLREASESQNAMTKLRVGASNPRTGVYLAPNGRWIAMISIDKKQRSIGRFATKEEAIAARENAERVHYGDFAKCP